MARDGRSAGCRAVAIVAILACAAGVLVGVGGDARGAERPSGGGARMRVDADGAPFGGVWVALAGGDLSAAAMGVVTLGGPRPRRDGECRSPGRCQPPAPRATLAGDRAPPLGPIADHGVALFTSAAGRRIYAYPRLAQGERRVWEDDWSWALGARIDALRLVEGDASGEGLFALIDLGFGLADEPVDPTDYRLRARLLVGGGAAGSLLYGFGEVGAGSKDPGRPDSGAVFGRAGIEVRF